MSFTAKDLHPFLANACQFDQAVQPTEKTELVQNMLEIGDEIYRCHGDDGRSDPVQQKINSGLKTLSRKTQMVVSVVQNALRAESYRKTNYSIYRAALANMSKCYEQREGVDPDLAQAATAALQFVTARETAQQ